MAEKQFLSFLLILAHKICSNLYNTGDFSFQVAFWGAKGVLNAVGL
ncbi:hypothetical protein EIKCOROL_00591 [Eikenella corrodens ATCC 23834]|uniref:Uncharacterized protein n=1 Tax=Eikenella corrodens ATCC 23834 TaxID=546274 RepID=C0DTB3_EIKCO|nr:hypothetical protein EIKCOROL_00591 [Eikenella corrodens ATCC 23834]